MNDASKNKYILTLIIKEALKTNRLKNEVQDKIYRNIKLEILNGGGNII